MADQEYEVEVEIVDDNPAHVVGEDAGTVTSETPEQKAERQAKAEQDNDRQRGEDDETPSRRRSRLRDRVDELTRKYRTEERMKENIQREKEQLEQQYSESQRKFQQNQQQNAKFVKDTLTKHERLLRANLKYARDRGDTDTEERLSNELVEVGTQLKQLQSAYPDDEGTPQGQQQATQEQSQEQAKPTANQPQITEAGRDWIDANSFLREHKNVHQIIANHEAILRAQNEDPGSVEFYKKLNKRIAQDVPKDIAERLRVSMNDDLDDDDGEDDDDTDVAAKDTSKKPRTGMADGGRSTAEAPRGKQKVKLTQDEVNYCNRMGIDKQAYAKEKAMTQRQNANGYTPIV